MSNEQLLHSVRKTHNRVQKKCAEYLEVRRILGIYKTLLKNAKVKPVPEDQVKKIQDYSVERFGKRSFYPWLLVYTAYQGKFLPGWIPNDYFEHRVLPRTNGSYRHVGAAKTLTRKLLGTSSLPDTAYHINGQWYSLSGEPLGGKRVKDILFAEGDTSILKLEASRQGKGIVLLHADEFDKTPLPQGNFVAQRKIKQHESLSELYPGSVANIRITTAYLNGAPPRACASHLRIGRGKEQFVTAAGALKVPITSSNGELGEFASSADWVRYWKHPDTHIAFEGFKIPHFQEAVALCEKLHLNAPQFGVIGWDVAVSENGEIEVMEWNTTHPGIKFSEPAMGPSFKDFNFEQYAVPPSLQ